MAWPIPRSLLFWAKESLGACRTRVSTFSICMQPWEGGKHSWHRRKHSWKPLLYCITPTLNPPSLETHLILLPFQLWRQQGPDPQVYFHLLSTVLRWNLWWNSRLEQQIDLSSYLSRWASIAQFLGIVLTVPSFYLQCLFAATLWFHNHSNSHGLSQYFITFPVSSVSYKPGFPDPELDMIDWYENQHVIL